MFVPVIMIRKKGAYRTVQPKTAGQDAKSTASEVGAYRTVQPKTGGWQETVLEQLSEAEFRVATELFYVEAEKVK